MGGGTLHVVFDSRNLRPERLDSLVQFLDRHRVQVLLCQFNQRVAGLAWKEVFQVHAGGR